MNGPDRDEKLVETIAESSTLAATSEVNSSRATESRQRLGRAMVSLCPLEDGENRFTSLFSSAISEQGYAIEAFRWRSLGLRRSNFVFIHWPDDFFTYNGTLGRLRPLVKLSIMHTARVLWGTRFIWVAHNAVPHDASKITPLIRSWFLRSLSGVVFLSKFSRDLISALYPEIALSSTLTTVHGHYRGSAAIHATPPREMASRVSLITFGKIRRYKNIELLVDLVASMSAWCDLRVAGSSVDSSLCDSIRQRAQAAEHIHLDLRDVPISDAELEGVIDCADAVVLPYKNVLNSGSALFALSRNRPVLAPNMGSLPELRDDVGKEWMFLYDGQLTGKVLMDFRDWMLGTKRDSAAPLDAYDFARVGSDLHGFLQKIAAAEPRHLSLSRALGRSGPNLDALRRGKEV